MGQATAFVSMLTSCRRMFAPKRSSTPQSRHSRRDAAVDRQNMELPITLLADHPLQLGNFTSAHLGTFKSALTFNREHDGPIYEQSPNRAVPVLTNDLFVVSGRDGIGAFAPIAATRWRPDRERRSLRQAP